MISGLIVSLSRASNPTSGEASLKGSTGFRLGEFSESKTHVDFSGMNPRSAYC